MISAFVADVHVGNFKRHGGAIAASLNARCQHVLATLESAVRAAQKAGAKRFVVCGDLLDYSRPEAPLLSRVQQILRSASKHGMECLLLVGNHEQISTAPGDHALGVLSTYAVVIERPVLLGDLVCVPFQPGPAEDWLPVVLRGMLSPGGGAGQASPPKPGQRTLVLHLGIRDEVTPVWLRSAPDSVHVDTLAALCAEHSIGNVIAGNWHNHQTWTRGKVRITQLGALCPTGWDNPGLDGYGTVGLLDGAKLARVEVSGPRFIVSKSLAEARALVGDARTRGHQPYLSLTADPEDLPDVAAWIEKRIGDGTLAGGEAVPDSTLAKHEAQNAAKAASGSHNIDEALVHYVEHKPMPEGVSAAAVLRRCREYLQQGQG